MHTSLIKNATQGQMNITDNKSVKILKFTVDWTDMEVLWRR